MTELEISLFQTGKDGRPMVLVPGGVFLYGPNKAQTSTERFYIDRYPVTNAEYKKFVAATGHSDPPHWRRGTWPDGKAHHPVVQITWESAQAYAEWAGKRLPTEIEWEKAARGTDGRSWPWGNVFDPKKCNTASDGTTPIGAFSPAGDSPYGAVDMAGNVWEWIGGKRSPLRMPLRGGNWLDGKNEATVFYRRMHTPYRKNDFIGFRCASDQAAPMSSGTGAGEES